MNKTFQEYGYIRVSSVDQNVERQLLALAPFNIHSSNIYIDKVSGKDFNRPHYQKLRRKLKPGDTVYIKSIDRLGRDYQEIISEWQYLTKDKDVDICILDMPILDTRKNKDLLGTFISDIVLYLLSYVAQQEREFNKIRQAEGIAAARIRGVHLGRKKDPYPDDFDTIYQMWKNKELTASDAIILTGGNKNRFYYLKSRYEKDNKTNINS